MSNCQHASVESLLQRPFSRGGRCEVTFTDQNIQSFKELTKVVRGKIECLRFIPDSELRVQYVDDENTLINQD